MLPPPLLFLIAGEPSGDFLGAQLMKALKKKLPVPINFVGIGGPLMQGEGLSSLFPMEELSVMGLVELIPHLYKIYGRIHETVESITQLQPHCVVTIDSPGFNFRVGKLFKKHTGSKQIPLVHYVAPSVWAWRSGRAKKIAKFIDHLLAVLPFEPPYFERENLPTTFIGHPIAELDLHQPTDLTFQERFNIPSSALLITVLPGSRRGELKRHIPIFRETIVLLRQKIPNLHVVCPTLAHLQDTVLREFGSQIPITVVTGQKDKYTAFQESTAALAASGTVTLELAAAGLPMVVGYKIFALTYLIIKRLVSVQYVSLVNLLLNKNAVSEFLQDRCTPHLLAAELEKLLLDPAYRQRMKEDLVRATELIHPPAPYTTPSDCAAEVIIAQLANK